MPAPASPVRLPATTGPNPNDAKLRSWVNTPLVAFSAGAAPVEAKAIRLNAAPHDYALRVNDWNAQPTDFLKLGSGTLDEAIQAASLVSQDAKQTTNSPFSPAVAVLQGADGYYASVVGKAIDDSTINRIWSFARLGSIDPDVTPPQQVAPINPDVKAIVGAHSVARLDDTHVVTPSPL